MHTLQDAINEMNENELADALRRLNFGDLVRHLPVHLTRVAPAASASQLVTVNSVALAPNAKAGAILRAYARAGTGTLGELTIAAAGSTPGAHNIAVAPNGDLAFLAADAYTSVDVLYAPLHGYSVTMTMPVVSNVLTLPAGMNALALSAATSAAGTLTGAMIVLQPGGAPATTKANLSADHKTVMFAVADAVTSATVTVIVAADIDVNAALPAQYP